MKTLEKFNLYIAKTETNITVEIVELGENSYKFFYHDLKRNYKWTDRQESPQHFFPQERHIGIGFNFPNIIEYHANWYVRDLPNFEQSYVRQYLPSEAPQKLREGAYTLGRITD
jgi:hypothetical protein